MSVASRSKSILVNIVSPLIVFSMRKWSNSWRMDNSQMGRIDNLLANGERLIIVLWHGKYIPLFALAEGRNALVFTSQSFRGDIITKICKCFGYRAVLVPSDQRNKKFQVVSNALKSANLGAIVVDGPLGPRHQVKSGVIKLASNLGFLIVPVSMSCNPKRVMAKRWDKRELPHWGAKVSLTVGDPVRIPAELNAQEVDAWSARLRIVMKELDQKAELKTLL